MDYGLFWLMTALGGGIAAANITARLVSSVLNFTLNKRLVFGQEERTARSAARYFSLAAFILVMNTLLLKALTLAGLGSMTAKILTETVMFTMSYVIQHKFVFAKEDGKKMKKHIWAVCCGLALTAFTAYISLDTFVISRPYEAAAAETASFESLSAAAEQTGGSGNAVSGGEDTGSTSSGEKPEKITQNGTKGRKKPSAGNAPSGQGAQTEKKKRSRSSASVEQDGGNSKSGGQKSSGSDAVSSASVSGSTAAGEYKDENGNISVKLSEYYENGTRIYAAEAELSSAEYLKTAFANDTFGKNVTAKTSETAAAHNAVLAVNGDYCGVREKGYVIRNGTVYRDVPSENDLLCIFADGRLEIMSQSEHTAAELVSMGVWQAFDFGPALVENGSVTVGENDEVGRAKASNPRTAIGITESGKYLFVVSDGRTTESEGLSLYELAGFMKELGAVTAYNLDGGGSSTMYFMGEVVNDPTSGGSIRERAVSDIVYIG